MTSESVFVGLDVKRPDGAMLSVDEFVTPQCKEAVKQLKHLGSQHNNAQLFEWVDDIECKLSGIDCVVVAVFLPTQSIPKLPWRIEQSDVTESILAARGWQLSGWDVCDVDGFFSVFGIEPLRTSLGLGDGLIASMEDALRVAADADRLVPPHAPFLPVKLMQLDVC